MSLDNHKGKAHAALRRMLWRGIILLFALLIGGAIAQLTTIIFSIAWGFVFFLWILFTLFTLWFFRDPEPHPPADPALIISPAHGKVDFIGEYSGPEWMGPRCRRISIFLSIFDIHVQNAPIEGKVELLCHSPGQYLNAMNPESAVQNENVLIKMRDSAGKTIGIRLIAGLIARRIVPWVREGEKIAKGERIGLIQFGSRVDLYLPLEAEILIQQGEKVRGGETPLAKMQ